MNRLILRALNSPILVILTAIAVAVQSSLFASWPLRFFQPDVVLLVVIWCGLKRSFLEGGIITLIIGEIAELHSSAPQGIFLIAYMLVYLLLRAGDKLFVLPTQLPMVKVTMSSAAIWHVCVMIVLGLMSGQRHLWTEMVGHLVPGAVMAAIFGAWVYRGLDTFDAVTHKNTNENPDEFQIENLGL